MKRRLNEGRLLLPKNLRERYNYDDIELEIIDKGDGSLIVKPSAVSYTISKNEMKLLRKLYLLIKDSLILEDTDLEILKDICKVTNVICPKCGKEMFLENNSYVCLNCEEE